MEIMNQYLYERVEREKYSHIHNNVLTESYRLKDTFYHTRCYPTLQRLLEKRNSYFNNIKGKIILDIGCGWGDTSLSLLKRGAIIKGIDITPEYIERAKKTALDNGFLGDQFEFKVMDAHKLDFENKSFDIVIGEGILHHLELYSSLEEIQRVLIQNGRALFIEPLADNPLLKLFRFLTPKARTIDEKPLGKKELNFIDNSTRWEVESSYCGLVSLPIAFFTSILLRPFPNNFLIRIADKFEGKINKYHFLTSMNQYVLLNLVKR